MKKNTKNNNKIIIGFDFDDVIIDHTKARIKKVRELGYKINFGRAIANRLRLSEIVKRGDYKIIQQYIYGKATLKAPPVKDAIKIINKLAKNYKLIIISRREPNFQNLAIRWLEQHRLLKNIPRQSIFFSENDAGKNIIAEKIGVFLFLDDKTEVLDAMENVPHKILFDQFGTVKNFKFGKIKKWREFPAIVEKLIVNLQPSMPKNFRSRNNSGFKSK